MESLEQMHVKRHLEPLIEKYKKRIDKLQKQSVDYEKRGMAGACISINGEVQAYNAALSDLKNILTYLKKQITL